MNRRCRPTALSLVLFFLLAACTSPPCPATVVAPTAPPPAGGAPSPALAPRARPTYETAEATRRIRNRAARLDEAFAVMRAYEGEALVTALGGLGMTEDQVRKHRAALQPAPGEELAEGRADALLGFAQGFGRTDRRLRTARPKAAEVRPDPALKMLGLPDGVRPILPGGAPFPTASGTPLSPSQ